MSIYTTLTPTTRSPKTLFVREWGHVIAPGTKTPTRAARLLTGFAFTLIHCGGPGCMSRVEVAVGNPCTTGCPGVLHFGRNLAAETERFESVPNRLRGSGDGRLILVWGRLLLFLVDGFEALADPFKVF